MPVTVLKGDVFAAAKACGRDRGQCQSFLGNWAELPAQTEPWPAHLQVRSSHMALVVAPKTPHRIKYI